MKSNKYVLEISSSNTSLVKDLLLSEYNKERLLDWKYETIIYNESFEIVVYEFEDSKYFSYINIFLDMLDGNYEKLALIGVQKNDITIWNYFKYENQCNMELSPYKMKRLGDNNITLCISCMDMAGDKYLQIGDNKVLKTDWF